MMRATWCLSRRVMQAMDGRICTCWDAALVEVHPYFHAQLAAGKRQSPDPQAGLTGYVPSTASKWGEKYPYSLTNRLATARIDHSLCSTRLPRIFDDDSSPIHSHSSNPKINLLDRQNGRQEPRQARQGTLRCSACAACRPGRRKIAPFVGCQNSRRGQLFGPVPTHRRPHAST